jgi:hypothetical protein
MQKTLAMVAKSALNVNTSKSKKLLSVICFVGRVLELSFTIKLHFLYPD